VGLLVIPANFVFVAFSPRLSTLHTQDDDDDDDDENV